jgi:hypothetical protein
MKYTKKNPIRTVKKKRERVSPAEWFGRYTSYVLSRTCTAACKHQASDSIPLRGDEVFLLQLGNITQFIP